MARGARAQARRGPHRGARRGDKLTRGPASPKRRGAGGDGRAFPHRLGSLSPRSSRCTATAVAREGGGSCRERGTTLPARPQAPGRRPGALQGHHRGPGDARAGAARRRGAPPRRGVGAARGTQPGGKAECPLRRETPPPPTPREEQERQEGEVGPGPAPRPLHTPPAGGEERRGARGQNEKSGPTHQECPSLVWRGLDPAQESATSPHRSIDPAH